MICYWIPGEYWSPGKICYWSPGKFLPALSALRHPAGPSSAAGPARLEIPANLAMTKANGDGAMRDGALGASAASIRRSQTRADAKREAKDREREKRQSRQQNEQSMREYRYAQYRDDAAKDLQVHTLSYRHYATYA
jgi:hypothetical protein